MTMNTKILREIPAGIKLALVLAMVTGGVFAIASTANAAAVPIAHWTFDQGTISGTTVQDVSGNGNNGTNFAAVPVNGCMYFNGDDSRIDIPNFDRQTFTFAAWVKKENGGNGTPAIIAAKTGGGWGVGFRGDPDNGTDPSWFGASGSKKFALSNIANGNVASNSLINPGQWYHLTVTYDGSTAKFYVNGSLDATQSYPTIFSSGDIYHLGWRSYAEGGSNASLHSLYDSRYKGYMEDVRIYGNVLGSADINVLAQNQPTCQAAQQSSIAQCSDGIDNDGDGAVDFPNDFSCSSATDDDETNPKAQCQDGIDNDGDGLTDLFDPGCFGRQDNDESNAAAFVACSTSSQCAGNNGYTGASFCQGNSIYRNYQTWTCVNPGAANSYCAPTTTVPQLQNTCAPNQACNNGTCVATATTCISHASQKCSGGGVYWFDSCGNQQELVYACVGNQTCQNNTCVNIGPITTTTNLTSTKQARNLSSGNLTWANTTSAAPSDVVQFQITVKNNATQTISNVVVKDTFPANLNYYNALTLDGVANSGSIISGLNIGNITAGQTRMITYQAQVAPLQNFGFGTTTLTNSVTISSSEGTNPASGSKANISVTRTSGATAAPTGWTDNIFFDSFFLPLMLALAGLWAWKSGLLGSLGFAGLQNRAASNKLAAKIAQIRQRENA